jgi:hypothetical protein
MGRSGREKTSFSEDERKNLSKRMSEYNKTRILTPDIIERRKVALRKWQSSDAAAGWRKKSGDRLRALNGLESERIRRRENLLLRQSRGEMRGTRPSRIVVPILPTKKQSTNKRRRKSPISDAEKQRISIRMKNNNPMFRAEVRAKASASMKALWRDAEFSELERSGASPGPNKLEQRLLTLIEPLGFRYVGDGRFWIGPCTSGKRRNPDFLHGSGKNKRAVLLHGRYWHSRADSNDEQELVDYLAAGWTVKVILENDLAAPERIIQMMRDWLVGLGECNGN